MQKTLTKKDLPLSRKVTTSDQWVKGRGEEEDNDTLVQPDTPRIPPINKYRGDTVARITPNIQENLDNQTKFCLSKQAIIKNILEPLLLI